LRIFKDAWFCRFAKRDRENLDADEVAGFMMLAKGYLALSQKQIGKMLLDKSLDEII